MTYITTIQTPNNPSPLSVQSETLSAALHEVSKAIVSRCYRKGDLYCLLGPQSVIRVFNENEVEVEEERVASHYLLIFDFGRQFIVPFASEAQANNEIQRFVDNKAFCQRRGDGEDLTFLFVEDDARCLKLSAADYEILKRAQTPAPEAPKKPLITLT